MSSVQNARPVWRGAMSKEQIAKQDLERIAMQEIRAFPDCEHVTEVEIEYQVDQVLKTNFDLGISRWHPDPVAAIEAAKRKHRKLS